MIPHYSRDINKVIPYIDAVTKYRNSIYTMYQYSTEQYIKYAPYTVLNIETVYYVLYKDKAIYRHTLVQGGETL